MDQGEGRERGGRERTKGGQIKGSGRGRGRRRRAGRVCGDLEIEIKIESPFIVSLHMYTPPCFPSPLQQGTMITWFSALCKWTLTKIVLTQNDMLCACLHSRVRGCTFAPALICALNESDVNF